MTQAPSSVGPYQVHGPLGEGGMGTLFLGWDPKLERPVAIKLLRGDDDELRERFAREAKAAAKLNHRNIVSIFAVGEHEGRPYIAMEYVDGETLGEIGQRADAPSISARLLWIEELCAGLHYAHQRGIVHRDVKPANIMVTGDGSVKILDFGIARATDAAGMTQAGMLIGTLNYMSPEQVKGQAVDRRSDVFAVGTVMYELLSRRQAFPGTLPGVLHAILSGSPTPLADAVAGIDADIVRIVDRALSKDAAARYQELETMAREVRVVRERLEAADERRASTLLASAERAVHDGNFPLAFEFIEQAERLAPGLPSAAEMRSLVQKKRAEADEAERLRKAIADKMADARAKFDRGQFDDCLGVLGELLAADATHAEALALQRRAEVGLAVSRANAECQAGNLAEADMFVANAVALAPDDPAVADARSRVNAAVDAAIAAASAEADRRLQKDDATGARQILRDFRPITPAVNRARAALEGAIAERAKGQAPTVVIPPKPPAPGPPPRPTPVGPAPEPPAPPAPAPPLPAPPAPAPPPTVDPIIRSPEPAPPPVPVAVITPPAKAQGRSKLYLGAAAVLVALGGAAAYLYFTSQPQDAEQVASNPTTAPVISSSMPSSVVTTAPATSSIRGTVPTPIDSTTRGGRRGSGQLLPPPTTSVAPVVTTVATTTTPPVTTVATTSAPVVVQQTTSVPPQPVDDDALIRTALQVYADGFSERNVAKIVSVHRTASRNDLEAAFRNLTSQSLVFRDMKIARTGDTARVVVSATQSVVDKTIGRGTRNYAITFEMRKDANGWFIVSRK